MRLRPVPLTALLLLAAPLMASAQDADGIYAVIHQDAAARAARASVRENPQPSRRLPASALPAPARAQPAPAQGFASLFQFRPSSSLPEITVRPPIEGPAGQAGTSQPPASSGRPGTRPGEAAASTPHHGGPGAYCVRSCDGYFFPIGPAQSGASREAQDMTCNALCPGAEVALYRSYSGGGIETATGPRGQTYQSLRNAFRYREKFDATCTCSGLGATGLAHLAITRDFTLRSGDIVVTETGVRIFAGARRFPYRPSDFVTARSYSRLPADVHRRIAVIEAGIRAGETTAAAPAARLGQERRRAGMPLMAPATQPEGPQVANAASPRIIEITR